MKQLVAILFLLFLSACSKSDDKIEESTPKFEEVILHYNNGNIFCSGKHKVQKNYSRIRIGDWKFYNPSGKIQHDMKYNDEGGLVSEKLYYEDGKLKYDDQYDSEGELISRKLYNESGKIIETVIANEHIYLNTIYHENGNIKEEYFEKKVVEKDEEDQTEWTETTVKEFYPSGILKEQTALLDNKLNGEKKIWDSTGALLIKVKYEDGIILTGGKDKPQ